ADGIDAAAQLGATTPDLVFLDIRMPGLDGFGVLESLPADAEPVVVFVTAYDEHAVRAFDVNACDYLLKPIEPARLDQSLARVRERLRDRQRDGTAPTDQSLHRLVAELARQQGKETRFLSRHGNRIVLVRASEVDWIESAGNYVKLHTPVGQHLVRETMKALEQRLDPSLFLRVHRTAIVNIERIVSVEPHLHGELVLTLKDGARLTTSRTHSAELRRLLRGS
ncbi:MAG: LytR/AlgR family response regulator transcription factor, partial [Gemmatimonadales bacterium]